jgi:hypothetical protein
MNTDHFIKSLCEAQESPEVSATLFQDGQQVSTGVFSLDSKRCAQGIFRPSELSILRIDPSNLVTLKLSGKAETLVARGFHRCPTPLTHHYHFGFEVQLQQQSNVARPNASSRPSPASGPMPARTTPVTSGPPSSHSSSTTTTFTACHL